MRLTGLFCPHMAGTYQKRSLAGALFLLTLTDRSGSGGAGNQCDGRNSISVEMCEIHRPRESLPFEVVSIKGSYRNWRLSRL